MTNDLFSMFNIVDTHEDEKRMKEEALKAEQEKKKLEEQEERTAKLKAQLSKSTSETDEDDSTTSASDKNEAKEKAKKEAAPKFTIKEDTIIRYHPDEIPVTKYFSVEEITEGILEKGKDGENSRTPITAEMLRKRMEADYPELQPNYVDIVYLAKQNIICPYPKAKKKGAILSDCMDKSDSRPTNDIKGEWKFSKIPFQVLHDFLGLASFMAETELEVHADIYYSPTEHTFFMDVPKQEVHKYWVEVDEPAQEIAERVGGAVKVMEIHSHHIMVPVPSFLDNESERFPGMVYAIVGGMKNYFPQITVRQFISEEVGHRAMEIEDVFNRPFTTLPDFEHKHISRG